MGGFDIHLRPPSPGFGPGSEVLPPVPDVKLSRPSLLGPAEGSATLDGFATNSAALTPNHRRQLKRLAGHLQHLLSQPPGGRVQAVGHTDLVGTEAHNDKLGQQRADAVRDGLVADGLRASDIHTHSLGESVPVVDTPRANPRNRRVEVYFDPNSGPNLHGLLTGGLKRPSALHPTSRPSPRSPNLRPGICTVYPEACQPTPPSRAPGNLYTPVPPPVRNHNGLRQFFEHDPLLRKLPRWLRDKAVDGLMSAPDAVARQIAKQLPTGQTRDAIEAILRALAAYMTGHTWSPPPSRDPRFDMPPSHPFPSAPGQHIFTIYTGHF